MSYPPNPPSWQPGPYQGTPPPVPAMPPGWYPDPAQAGFQRQWDGHQWVGPPAPAGAPQKGGFPKWLVPVLACVALAATAVIIGVVASSTGDDEDADRGTTTTTEDQADDPTTTEPASTEPTTTESTTTTTEASANPSFGETFEWDDGLAITVSPPTRFTPSDTAVGGEGAAAHVSFELRVVNGSDANFDPNEMFVSIQSGSTEGDQVFDTEQGFDGTPSTVILPGREAVFLLGFGVEDPADLVVQVTPGFDYDEAFFTS